MSKLDSPIQSTILFLTLLLTGCGGAGSGSAPPHAASMASAAPPAVEKPRPTKPAMLTRAEWKAKPPRGEGKAHTIDRITVHHTAVAQNTKLPLAQKLQNLQHFSQNESKLASGKTKPAWSDVPYHFYIAHDGKIAEGRLIKFASDTNTEYDPTNHATIVLEGNFETEHPTAEQLDALTVMVAWLAAEYMVPRDRIASHNDFAKTACPGANLKKALPALVEKIKPND